MKSKTTSSFSGLNSSWRPGELGDMLAQKKIDDTRQLTPEQRLRGALELSNAAVALHHAGSKKR